MTTLAGMHESDAFFTHTIVGAPFTVLLGSRLSTQEFKAQGLDIDLPRGTSRLSEIWQDWWVLSHDLDPTGRPRRRPERFRRWLERHALWMALVGLVSLGATGVIWGMWLWS